MDPLHWIEATGTATASEATYVPQFGTDVNEDGFHELWVKQFLSLNRQGELGLTMYMSLLTVRYR